ncbi:kelch-like, partial [Perkinsus olseni]
AVTRAMQRYFTLVHSSRPSSDSGSQRERDAAAQLLQEITRALRIQAVHARRLSEPVRVVHDKPLVFDSSKWDWVDEQALFAGRTAAAISVGSVFPASYGGQPRRCSGRLMHSSVRLSGSEVVHAIVSPGTRLPVENELLRLTTSRDCQAAANVQLVVSGGRTASSACQDFLKLTRELDTST